MMPTAPDLVLIAGNGFVGRAVAERAVLRGLSVTVHHTGSHFAPDGVRSIVVPRTPLPIIAFPDELVDVARGAVVVHMQCMGEADGAAFIVTLDGIARRLVLISSADVYRAYGRFTRTEPGPPDPTPLAENAPLRERLFPYREQAERESDLLYWYDKLEAERTVRSVQSSETVIQRLPKVYGPERNADLASVYGFRDRPNWRWTHGHVENVAAAIVLASEHAGAAGETFNLGEADTPTMGERLADLPARPGQPSLIGDHDLSQDMHTDTSKVRRQLGYVDIIDERAAMAALTARVG